MYLRNKKCLLISFLTLFYIPATYFLTVPRSCMLGSDTWNCTSTSLSQSTYCVVSRTAVDEMNECFCVGHKDGFASVVY